MKFFLLGATGFVGRPLIRHILKAGHEVAALARSAAKAEDLPPGIETVVGDPLKSGGWQEAAGQADVLVNLVGSPIMTRWTEATKRKILDSRVLSTRMAVDAIPKSRAAGVTLVNANAVGYYGDGQDEVLTEESPLGEGFLAEVAQQWEREAQAASAKGARVVVCRFGVVLGRDGGMLAQMLPPFRLGVGGRLGSGRQWTAWIHIHDLVRALLYVSENAEISGAVNMCAPNPVTNRELTKALARVLARPALLPVPEFALKLLIGGAAEIALEGQRAVPRILEKAGFAFEFPTIGDALRDLLGG